MTRFVLIVLVLAGCNSSAPEVSGGDAVTSVGGGGSTSSSASAGGSEPCANGECTSPPDAHCSSATTLTTYADSGSCVEGACDYAPQDVDCGALGCCVDHCCGIAPSNEEDLGPIGGGPTLALQDGAFDTTLECNTPSILGDCEVVQPDDSPEVCVCRVSDLSLQSLTVTGERALAILADGKVTITGAIYVSGALGVAGPGAAYPDNPVAAATPSTGGSYSTNGGGTGAANAYGTEEIIPLQGGMSGQTTSCGGFPGGGGGAIQITAAESIEVLGSINAGGGGGDGGHGSCCPGLGGGSGGAILLEAPSVNVTGVLAANGGGGGSGADNSGIHSDGYAGYASTTAAAGGYSSDGDGCLLYGYTSGGDGGQGSSLTSSGASGQWSDYVSGCFDYACVGEGGGGGGAGRIRINVMQDCECGTAVVSPPASIGSLQTQ